MLLVFSVNRFVLAGLSAALPHVVTRDLLVSANSVAPTVGSLAYLLGGALGGVLARGRQRLLVVLTAVVGVLVRRMGGGPAAVHRPGRRRARADGAPGAQVGGRRASSRRSRTLPRRARLLLGLVFLTRLPFGFMLLQTLLLFRGPFATRAATAGLGFGLAAGASAAGFALAAFVTPWLAPRWGRSRMPPDASRSPARHAGAGPVAHAVEHRRGRLRRLVLVAGVKINVDSLMQAHVPDHLLGRAFSAYDVVYNAGLVAAAALGRLRRCRRAGSRGGPSSRSAAGYGAVGAAARPALGARQPARRRPAH